MASPTQPNGVPRDERPRGSGPNSSEPRDRDGRPRGRESRHGLPTVLGWVAVAVALAAAAWLLLTVLAGDDARAPDSTPVGLIGSGLHLHDMAA